MNELRIVGIVRPPVETIKPRRLTYGRPHLFDDTHENIPMHNTYDFDSSEEEVLLDIAPTTPAHVLRNGKTYGDTTL